MQKTYNGNDVFAPFNAGLYGIDDDPDCSLLVDESKASILAGFEAEYKPAIVKALADAGIEYIGLEYYSPRFYNYATDSIDLKIEVINEAKLKAALLAKREEITEALAANKASDGYMPLTADSFEEVLAGLQDPDIIAITAILAGIPFADFDIYDSLEWDYPCENCGRIHSEKEYEEPEDATRIEACEAGTVYVRVQCAC